MTRLGADATNETIAALKALGITFIGRYVSDYPGKNLTLPEAQRVSAAGIDLVTNWENDVNDWAGGYSQGVAFAKRALTQHAACGGPTGRSERWGVYFSVDEKVDPNDPTLHAYFQGANTVLSVAHTGAYAQTSVLRALRQLGLIGCGERGGTWRSMSTFNLPEGLGLPGEFDIEQDGQFNPQYDKNIANSGNFGQWRIGATVTIQEDPMQDALYAVTPGPNGEQPGIWWYADGAYTHVPTIAQRDLIAAQFGAQQKPLPYTAHQLLLARTTPAPAAAVDTQALATSIVTALGPIVQQAVATGVQPDYGHMATVLEAHLAATITAGNK